MSNANPPCDRVLLVDDDKDTLETLELVLQLEGVHEVRLARSVAEAESVLASPFRPAAIVLDLLLGPDRGETLLERLQADPALQGIPVIALSGDRARLEQAERSVTRTLLKPAQPAEIVEALREACRPS